MAILWAGVTYMLEMWKLRFYYIIWHIQGHTGINRSGLGLAGSCNFYCCIILSLFCFGNDDSGMNEICSVLLDAVGRSHYVFKFPREMTVVGIKKKSPFNFTYLWMCQWILQECIYQYQMWFLAETLKKLQNYPLKYCCHYFSKLQENVLPFQTIYLC